MKPVLNVNTVREMERRSGRSEIDMVAQAAKALWAAASEFAPRRARFLCGPGNNGADGYAAAILARQAGAEVSVRAVFPPKSEAARRYAARADGPDFDGSPDLWVDAIFGSGLRTEDNPTIRALREEILVSGAPVVAADVPTGLDADTGWAADWAIPARRTVTMGFWKPGLLFGDGPDLCGDVILAELGFPAPDDPVLLLEPRDAAAAYAPRRKNSHKNTYGHLLILAGSEGMAGAAALCARAALRGGVGLTTVVCPRRVVPILQVLAPEAMCRAAEDISDWPGLLQGKTAVAAGPGYTGPSEPIRAILESGLPAVLDAGALGILAREPGLWALLNRNHAITPHPGEARQLIPDLPEAPIGAAERLEELGCVAVYKGTSTVIAGEKVCVSRTGCPGMAKGGSGDALCGLIGALLAQGIDPERAAWAADELHGLAGEIAQDKRGDISMTAMDLIDCVPEAIRRIRSSA